jgi:cytochrome c-type biogenesis protein CcsB
MMMNKACLMLCAAVRLRALGALGMFACVAVAVFATAARAQTAPAGNAHPATEMTSAEGRAQLNPFGAIREKSGTLEEKEQFAQAVDLDPLRDLAVFHNGRVKILDTLARETVSSLTGKSRFADATPLKDGVRRKVSFDPLFTLLDLMIDPAFYLDRPLVAINYLPLREKILEAQIPGAASGAERTAWLKLGRVTPLMVQAHLGEIMEKHEFEEPYRNAAMRVESAFDLWRESPANMMLVAPASKSLPWAHLSTLPENHEARTAALELGAAWRDRDAAKVQEAIATLARVLPGINPEVYPKSARSLELSYNKSNAFEWGFWAYGVAFLTLILAFGTDSRWLVRAGVAFLVLAMLIHVGGFGARCVIAQRYAIQNQFESMTGLSLFGVTVGMVLMLVTRRWLFGAAAAGLGFLVLVTATQAGIPGEHIEREAAILNTSVLLKYHVTTVLVSYGLITLGAILSSFYLVSYYAAKWRATPASTAAPATARVRVAGGGAAVLAGGPGVLLGGGASDGEVDADGASGRAGAFAPESNEKLRALDTSQLIVLQLAFWTLGVGILLGAWWADHSWGRWWAFDPKETWALVTWIIYLIVIHLRFTTAGRSRGLFTAWLSVVGFIMMLWTYFGVNLLLPGLHAYA